MKLKSGDIVVAASPGDYGKPRPCLVVQAELFNDLASVTFCPLTTDLRDDQPLVRVFIAPRAQNGLKHDSHIAIDKITTLPVTRIAKRIGEAETEVMAQVKSALSVFLGIG